MSRSSGANSISRSAESARLQAYVFTEETPTPFDFESSATAHGWARLQPFEWDNDRAELRRIHRLTSGNVIRLRLRKANRSPNPAVQITVDTPEALTAAEETEIRRAVRRMLRLDEDLTAFYRLAARLDDWTLGLKPGGGRLLRCPTLFEDMVYTLCTTNIAWSGTIRMVERLTTHLGDSFAGREEARAFPTAEVIAAAGPALLKEQTGLGYRSDYVWTLASDVAEGRLDLARFEDLGLPTEALRQALLKIRGVGPYAAATLLMILGRYEHLAIDTEIRAFVSRKYFNGQPVTDAQIRDIYAPWGRWQYLAYWFDSPA
jgi:3-methyladenine DNA glycosylase/8-oxoguanine DNA glycosylase